MYSSDSSGENASPFGCTKSEATTLTRLLCGSMRYALLAPISLGEASPS